MFLPLMILIFICSLFLNAAYSEKLKNFLLFLYTDVILIVLGRYWKSMQLFNQCLRVNKWIIVCVRMLPK